MKIIRLLVLLIALFGQCALGLTLQEILHKQTDALGGMDRLSSVKSLVVKSNVSMGGMKGTTVSYYRAPDRTRTDVILPLMSSSQGCAGDDCWITDSQGLTHSLGADMQGITVTSNAISSWGYCDSARFNGVVSLADNNVSVDSGICYVVRITPRNGVPCMLYIDRGTFLPRQVEMKTDVGTYFTRFYDYRPVNGIMVAFRTTEMSDAGFVAGVSDVTDVKMNVYLADSLFVPSALASEATGLPDGQDSVCVPFELWHNHIYVETKINGRGPFRFIFDSGAGGIAINRKLVGEIGLSHLGTTEARGVGGADSSEVYEIDSLEVAGVRLTDLPGSSIDFDVLESATDARIDGIVGYDLLSRFVISVDYYRHLLVLYRSGIEPRLSWGRSCRLTIDLRLPYVDAMVQDTIPGRFRLDTGSASTIDYHTPFVLAHGLLDSSSASRSVTSAGVGGTVQGNVGMSPKVNICGNEIESLLVHFSSTPTGIFAGKNTAGNVGAGVLKAFTVTFDYGRETVYFRENHEEWHPAHERNMAGIELEKSQDHIAIKRVVPGRAADGFLSTGDLITEINGQTIRGKSIKQVNGMLLGARGSDVRIKIERSGRVMEMDLLLDSRY